MSLDRYRNHNNTINKAKFSLYITDNNNGAPKVMIPIYFYRDYNRCREHNNNNEKNKCSATKHYFPISLPTLTIHFYQQ